jgi:thiamine pyrophosphokinase
MTAKTEHVLLVAGAPLDVELDALRRLADIADLVVAVDSGADALWQIGVTPALLIGDMDSIAPEVLNAYQAAETEIKTYNRDKDATDFELALALPDLTGAARLTAVGVLGGRLDHELAAIGTVMGYFEQFDVPVHILHDQQSVFLLNGSSSTTDCIKLLADQIALTSAVSVIAWNCDAEVSIKGLKWQLDHAIIKANGSLGVSNESLGIAATITVHSGTVLLILTF